MNQEQLIPSLGSTVELCVREASNRFAVLAFESPRLDAELLMMHVLGLSRERLLLSQSHVLSDSERGQFLSYIERRLLSEPIAYITGKKAFYGITCDVNASVLIPRPETEHLIEAVLAYDTTKNNAHIIDVCTGSGCVAIALAQERIHYQLTAIDVCPNALAVCKHNIQKNGFSARIKAIQGNLLEPVLHMRDIDVIVANPPYIKEADVESLPASVRNYEPWQALVGLGKNGLGHHAQILRDGLHILKVGGLVVLELGHDQAEEIMQIVPDGYRVEALEKDLAGHHRVLVLRQLGGVNK